MRGQWKFMVELWFVCSAAKRRIKMEKPVLGTPDK